MKTTICAMLLMVLVLMPAAVSPGQDRTTAVQQTASKEPAVTGTDPQAAAGKAFAAANTFMEQRRYSEALAQYRLVLAVFPEEPASLFNGGLAAYLTGEFEVAAGFWQRLKTLEPPDWRLRAKLVQVWQALGRFSERDAERTELMNMWQAGEPAVLHEQVHYCRDQFTVNGKKVMVLEHFELKGERALRYVFMVLNEAGDGEEFSISLGSYESTNAVWRTTTKPEPAAGARLFHLDGYFTNGHATYGFFTPEPSYDRIRAEVVAILEGKGTVISRTTVSTPAEKPPATRR